MTATAEATALNVICNRGELLAGLQACQRVTKGRTPRPILQCVRIAADGKAVELRATDLERSLALTLTQVQVEQPGAIAVPCDRLRDIVSLAIDETLTLEIRGDQLAIRGESVWHIYTLPASDMPPFAGVEGEGVVLPASEFAIAVRQVAFAAAKEAMRYSFNGVLFDMDKTHLTLVATDGHILSRTRLPCAGKNKRMAIVPRSAFDVLAGLADDEDLTLMIGERQVQFQLAGATLVSNTVEGQFPPYDDVVPRDPDKQSTLNVAEFTTALKQAAVCCDETSKGVRMSFNKKGLTMTARSPTVGESEVMLPCKYRGADIEIGVNPVFMLAALAAAEVDEIKLNMNAPNRPMRLDMGREHVVVIMPVKLQ